MRIALGLAAALLLFATASYAEEQAAPREDPRDEIICKNMARDTGSRLGNQRECHTRREWEERRRDDRFMTERAQQTDRRNGP
jgi:hypothetical protein